MAKTAHERVPGRRNEIETLAHRLADEFMFRISDLDQGIDDIFYRILGPSVESFSSGTELDDDAFVRLFTGTRAIIAGLDPVLFLEEREGMGKQAVRREFLSVHRVPMMRDRYGHSLAGMRISMTRERVTVEKDYLGLDIQRHAMFRSVQRGVVPRDGGFDGLDEFTVEALGLAVIWRHAKALGFLGMDNVAMPFRQGLMLGSMLDIRDRDLGSARRIDASGVYATALAPNHFNSADIRVDGDVVTCAPVVLNTVLGADTMGRARHDLHAKLVSFGRRHASLVHQLATGSAWQSQDMAPHPRYTDLLPAITEAASRLGDLLANPRYRDACRPVEQREAGNTPEPEVAP
jgi:hypothetical protein